jgi:SAM-dependent methyltransferase
MRAILPSWLEPDPMLLAQFGEVFDPDRRVLAALDRIIPISGKRIADVGTGIGHYPLLLARRTGRTYGIEQQPELLRVARERADAMHQPNIRIVEGVSERLPLRDAAVDVVLSGQIEPRDEWLPAIDEALRVLRPNGRLVVIGYYGRDDIVGLLEPAAVDRAMEATQRRTGWWLKHRFKIKVVHSRIELGDEAAARDLLPRLYGDRGRAFLEAPHPLSLRVRLGLYHLTKP